MTSPSSSFKTLCLTAAVASTSYLGCATQEDTGVQSISGDTAGSGESAAQAGSGSGGSGSSAAGTSPSSSGGVGGTLSPVTSGGAGSGALSTAGSGGSSPSVAGTGGSGTTTGGNAGAPSGGTSTGGKGGTGTAGTGTVQPDIKAPSTPGSLQTSAITSSSVTLSWTASTDNVGVTGYRLFNGGTQITTVTGTSQTFKGLASATDYTFGVEAYDAAANTSARATRGATTKTVTTPVCDASKAVAKLVHGNSYTANGSACIQLSVNPAWNPVDVLLEQTAGGGLSYSYKACNGNGSGTISSVVHFFTGTNPGCDFFVQLTGSGTVAYYD